MPTYTSSTPTERASFVEPGEYELEVVDADELLSKNSHEMIELKLRTPQGSFLYDFLVFTESAFWKIDAFRAATGEKVVPDDEVEINADDLIGRTGRARLVVEEYNGQKRNKVAAWIVKPGAATPAAQPQQPGAEEDDDDDIPF